MIDIVKISINPWLIGLLIGGAVVYRMLAQRAISRKPIAVPRDELVQESKKAEQQD